MVWPLLPVALMQSVNALAANADTIWYGGPIVTVNERAPSAEAVAIKDGKIVMVGKKDIVMKAERGPATELRDLKGGTFVPGFIDPHSHFIDSLSLADRINVSAPPVGPAKNADEITTTLQAAAKTRGLKPGELFLGYGYDENLMPKEQPPSRAALDLVILSANPLTVKPMAIKEIKVVETFKDGKTVYKAGEQS